MVEPNGFAFYRLWWKHNGDTVRYGLKWKQAQVYKIKEMFIES
jgi:hypothetical protein